MQFNSMQQRGLSLPELLLVLIVSMSIFYLSLRQYTLWRNDANAMQVRANADAIMQAMAKYHQQNCYGSTNPITYALTPGTLNPNHVPSPAKNIPIDINTDLMGNNLLAKTALLNPLLDQTTANPLSAYVAQFNLYPPHPRLVCTEGSNAPSAGSVNCTANTSIGSVVNYTIQVAILLKDTAHAQTYLHQLQGDCLSNLVGKVVMPCHGAHPITGPYVVWERQPGSVSSRDNATYWGLLPTVNQFTQMYTTANILVLTDGLATSQQSYLCSK